MRGVAAATVAASLALAGCSIFTDSFEVDGFSGDPFPIDVDTSTGALMIGVQPVGSAEVTGLIDLLSPFTSVDGGPTATPAITYPDVFLFGEAGTTGTTGAFTIPRAELDEPQLLTLHPCDDSIATCTVGPEGSAQAFGAIIGGDSLAGDDIRLDLGHEQIQILANVAGSEENRSNVCDAVFPSPYRGGGTAIINGTELGYNGLRVTVATCIAFDPDQKLLQTQRGLDALFVVSTALGTSLLSESAYERFRTFEGSNAPADLDALPGATIVLPSGPTSGHLATLPSLAYVGFDESTSRGPCREDYAHHLLLQRDCVDRPSDDCPCKDDGVDNGDDDFCSVPGIVELAPAAGFPFLVIPDDDPTLQALRVELAPDQADLDGILGTSALTTIQLDADYPNDRVLMRCSGDPSCVTRPELPIQSARAQVQNCIAYEIVHNGGSGGVP